MRILFAAADRDLLKNYRELLTLDGHETDTAFDGAQALDKMTLERFDLMIVGEDIPRVRAEIIVSRCRSENIPVIVLTARGPVSGAIPENAVPNAYLSLPFLPSDLTEVIERIVSADRHDRGS